VKLGLQLNSFDWNGGPERFAGILAEIAWAAEEAGFDHIGVSDHVWQHPIMGGPLLKITSLEDLKERVGKLVVLILAVEFFQRALRLSYESALEILYLAAVIALVSGWLYLIGRRSP
jgi:hypothetical protein